MDHQKANGYDREQLLEERDAAWKKHREAIAEEHRDKQAELERRYRKALAAQQARSWARRWRPVLHAVLFATLFGVWQGSFIAGVTAYGFLLALDGIVQRGRE